MVIELRHLRAFSAVGKELHFGRAADLLHVSQPALSKTIQQLEQFVGAPLLIRNTRTVELTDAGRAFLAETEGIPSQIEQAAISARYASRGSRGELRVAYTDFAISGRLPHFLREFSAAHPDIRLDLTFMSTTAQHTALLQQSIDVGFMIGGFEHETTSMLTLNNDRYVAALPADHPLCAEESLTLRQLAGEKFVLGTPDNWTAFRSLLFSECRKRGFFPDITLEASNSEGIIGLVVAGAGVTVYAECIRTMPRVGLEVRDLTDVEARLPVCAVWIRDSGSSVLTTFVTFLRKYVKAMPQE